MEEKTYDELVDLHKEITAKLEVLAEEDLENSEPQVKATGGEDASTTKEAPIPPPRGTIN